MLLFTSEKTEAWLTYYMTHLISVGAKNENQGAKLPSQASSTHVVMARITQGGAVKCLVQLLPYSSHRNSSSSGKSSSSNTNSRGTRNNIGSSNTSIDRCSTSSSTSSSTRGSSSNSSSRKRSNTVVVEEAVAVK